MGSDRQDISAAIVTQLKTVSALHNRVYAYEPGELTAFPTVSVVGAGFTDRITDTAGDLRFYEYDVIVYLQRGRQGFGSEGGERVRRELEDDVMAALDAKQTLDGTVLWLRARSGGWGYTAGNDIAFFILNLTACKHVTIS